MRPLAYMSMTLSALGLALSLSPDICVKQPYRKMCVIEITSYFVSISKMFFSANFDQKIILLHFFLGDPRSLCTILLQPRMLQGNVARLSSREVQNYIFHHVRSELARAVL